MDETPGLSDQYRTASPWPLFVALGVPIAELGVLFGVFPVAVGGLLLFGGSVAGLLREAGYAATPWRPLGAVAVLLVALGGALVLSNLGVATRGYAIAVAGVLLLAAGAAGALVAGRRGVPA